MVDGAKFIWYKIEGRDRGGVEMDIDEIVRESVEKTCKENGYSPKLTKLMSELVSKYRNEGTISDKELLTYIKRIQKNLPNSSGGD